MLMIHAKVTKVVFDHDGELSDEEVLNLEQKVMSKEYQFHTDEFCDISSVADAVSDDTGWCVSDIDYTAETKEG